MCAYEYTLQFTQLVSGAFPASSALLLSNASGSVQLAFVLQFWGWFVALDECPCFPSFLLKISRSNIKVTFLCKSLPPRRTYLENPQRWVNLTSGLFVMCHPHPPD